MKIYQSFKKQHYWGSRLDCSGSHSDQIFKLQFWSLQQFCAKKIEKKYKNKLNVIKIENNLNLSQLSLNLSRFCKDSSVCASFLPLLLF